MNEIAIAVDANSLILGMAIGLGLPDVARKVIAGSVSYRQGKK